MNDWEFLLQQQGDCAWLPLESATVEILEGFYQIMARSPQPETIAAPVTIQITHLSTIDGVAQRHWQQRSLETTLSGETIVLPVSYLAAGLWTLSWATDATPGLEVAVDPTAQSVQLQVQALEPDSLPEAWEPPLIPALVNTREAERELEPATPSREAEAESLPVLDLPRFSYAPSPWYFQVVEGPTLPPKLFESDPDHAPKPPKLPALAQPEPDPQPLSAVAASGDSPTKTLAPRHETWQQSQRFWKNLQALSQEIMTGEPDSVEPVQAEPDRETPGPGQVVLPDLAFLRRRQQAITSLAIPVPELVVQEVVRAGRPVTVYVRLPQELSDLSIKLWVSDRQTRTLLVKPRWLTGFQPNLALGMREALTQIILPLEAEAVSFAAIAVDRQTQRESHRTVVHRLIQPAHSLE